MPTTRWFAIAITLAALVAWSSTETWARGGRGGGGGGRIGGGGAAIGAAGAGRGYAGARPGGGYNAAAARTPSMSRSSLPASLSSPQRSTGTLSGPTRRPSSAPIGRPGGAVANLPTRGPSVGTLPRTGSLPSGGSRSSGGGRTVDRELKSYVDLPMSGGSNLGTITSSLPNIPLSGIAGSGALAGGAAAAFLHDRSTDRLPDVSLPSLGNIADTLPVAPSNGANIGDRTHQADRTRPAADHRPGNRSDATRPARPADRTADAGRPGRPGDRPLGIGGKDSIQNLPSRIVDRAQWSQWRKDQGNDIRDFIRTHPGEIHNWFEENWWPTQGINYPYYPGFDYWAWSQWPGVTNWVDDSWRDPVYYNFGENIYYQNGSVYYGDHAVATEEEYAKQAEAIATSAPDAKPDTKDWLPLGVFAVVIDGQPSGVDPNFFLQLALSKQGQLSGTIQNTATNSAQAIEGMVDRETQRAAWTAKGKLRPLMETGIVNLTLDSTPALVHFADGTTQQALLVRLAKTAAAGEAANN